MTKHIYTILSLAVALFMSLSVSAQDCDNPGCCDGPIMISSVADSTDAAIVSCGQFVRAFLQGETINIKGTYCNIENATQVQITYDVYPGDWAGPPSYTHLEVVANSDGVGTLYGIIDHDFTFPMDAATTMDNPGANIILQARVIYDPEDDTFWNLFVQLGDVVSVREIPALEGLQVYPNPVGSGTVMIETAENLERSVNISDATGKRLIQTFMPSNGPININNLPAGLYLVQVVEDGKVGTSKLIVE